MLSLLLALMPWPLAAAEPKPLVVATIKPLALIAQDVLGTHAEVRQLLPANVSPHAYALRVSERRLLARADLVLWIGPGFESFLEEAMRGRSAAQVLTAMQLPGIQWPPENPDGDARGGHEGHHHGDDPGADLHLWLDPRNAATIADALVTALVAGGHRVPAEASTAFQARMTQLEADLRARLAPVPTRVFAADHEAFGHFAARFDLIPAGHLRDAADRASGARSVAALTARTDIGCLVAEPDSQPERMRHLAERLGARLQVIDILGLEISAGDGSSYERLLVAVADRFAHCLGAPPPP